MKNKYAEILTLSESEVFSNQRSKSSSQHTSMNSPNNLKYKKNQYLIEKKDSNMISNDSNIKINQYQDIEISNTQKYSNELNNKRNANKSLNFEYDNLDKEESLNLSLYNSNRGKDNINKDREYLKLKEKYALLKSNLERYQVSEKNWRNSYFSLLQDSITFDETIKNLIEENRIHQEYIISLENKLNKLFVACNNITSNFHNSMSKNMYSNINSNELSYENTNPNLINTNSASNLSNLFMKNYSEVINDYKKQLEILSEEKDSLNTNLSILRHQQLQSTIKMENLQTRLFNLEQARLEELKFLEYGRK